MKTKSEILKMTKNFALVNEIYFVACDVLQEYDELTEFQRDQASKAIAGLVMKYLKEP